MPYTKEAPPKRIQHLPEHAQHIWIAAFNSALKQYGDEGRANAVAWAAVSNKYHKVDGQWVAKEAFAVRTPVATIPEAVELTCPTCGGDRFEAMENGQLKCFRCGTLVESYDPNAPYNPYRDEKGRYASGAGETPTGRAPEVEIRDRTNELKDEFERKYAIANYEYCLAIGHDGRVVLEKEGSRDTIHFTKDELLKMKSELSVFCHNHPGGSSFSDSDLDFACELGIDRMEVIGPRYRYIVTPGPNGWSLSAKWVHDQYYQELMPKYQAMCTETKDRYGTAEKHTHEAMKLTAAELGYTYWREAR